LGGEGRERFEGGRRRHTELVLPWADELLAEAGLVRTQLDAIAVGRGPGAFTGVRLAVALAQGMALALDLPVLPVSTLAVLAWPARLAEGDVLAAIDARMGEVYLGWFRADGEQGLHAVGPEWMAAPDKVDIEGKDLGRSRHPASRGTRASLRIVGVGSGFAAANGALAEALMPRLLLCDPLALPHAADLARLAALDFAAGRAIAPDQLEPAYLRDKVALTLSEQGRK